MSRSADLAAVLSARWISVRAGSVSDASGSGAVASSCCNWWIRKVRCALSADLAVAINSAASALAEALVARGFLRPGWPEEPAPDPPRLRKRGRGSGDRALAVDGAVMGSLHRLWDGAVGGLRNPLWVRRGWPSRQVVGHIRPWCLPVAGKKR
jgi:hypothetical protein